MEGGRGNYNTYYNSFYGNSENDNHNHTSNCPPSTAIDKFLWSTSHQENSYCPQQSFFNGVTNNYPPFLIHPNNVYTDYSTAGGGTIGGIFQSNSQRETRDDADEDDDILKSESSPAKSTLEKKGGSSTTSWIKGQWSVEEDRKLIDLVERYGVRKWALIAENMVGRIGKQCRERWQNHLRPDIKKDHWSEEEERLLIEAHERVGNKWAEIAKCIPGRTENSIKNHWNATKRKQVSKRKIKKPEYLNGIKHSVLLEEYIKKKCFNKGSTSTNSTNSTSKNSPTLPENSVSTSQDEESITYLAFEAYVEEMDFMKNLFGSKENSNIATTSAIENSNLMNNSSSTNILDLTPMMTDVVQMPLESVGNGSTSELNFMEQNGINSTQIPKQETMAMDTILYPEFYFCSYMLDGSLGNTGSSGLGVNQNNSGDAMEMDLMEMISSCNFS